jgi:hypothetical protein
MNITLNTKIDYDFSNFEVSPEKQLAIIRKYEKQAESIYFSSLDVKYTTDSDGEEYFKIFFYVKDHTFEVQYADKQIWPTSNFYENVRDCVGKEDKPFYESSSYALLNWITNDGNGVKYNLSQAIALIQVLRYYIKKEA